MFARKTPLHFVLVCALALPLLNCGGSAHDPTEDYCLVTVNSKIPYWQAAVAGLEQGARELQVKWEMVGPETYDAQAQKEEFRKVLRRKPSGILVSVAGGSGSGFRDEPAPDTVGDPTRRRFRHPGRVLAIAANPLPLSDGLSDEFDAMRWVTAIFQADADVGGKSGHVLDPSESVNASWVVS